MSNVSQQPWVEDEKPSQAKAPIGGKPACSLQLAACGFRASGFPCPRGWADACTGWSSSLWACPRRVGGGRKVRDMTGKFQSTNKTNQMWLNQTELGTCSLQPIEMNIHKSKGNHLVGSLNDFAWSNLGQGLVALLGI